MPARPLRPGETPPKGTAVIKGQVRSDGTGAPVRRAQVRAMSMEGRGGGVTNTDGNGQLRDQGSAGGALHRDGDERCGSRKRSSASAGPATWARQSSLPTGQTAEKVNFVLSRGGVISGTVVDDGGEPMASTQVAAMRFQFMQGSRRLVPAQSDGSTDRTDDKGGFRLYGLPPGDYYISASSRSNMFMVAGMTSTEQDGFAPTYYPGTPNVAEAARVTVKTGQEISGVNDPVDRRAYGPRPRPRAEFARRARGWIHGHAHALRSIRHHDDGGHEQRDDRRRWRVFSSRTSRRDATTSIFARAAACRTRTPNSP